MTTATTAAPPAPPSVAPMTRREFLYYIWVGSIALFAAQSGLATVWFLYPRFKEGTFGGIFDLPVSDLPEVDAPPKPFSAGRFWLVNIGEKTATDGRLPEEWKTKQTQGVKALYMICVHLGCLYAWVPSNNRFECPCHGSKYLSSGTAVAGPANRNLDVFVIEAVDDAGTVIDKTVVVGDTNGEGRAIQLTTDKGTATRIRVNTGAKLNGASNPTPSLAA